MIRAEMSDGHSEVPPGQSLNRSPLSGENTSRLAGITPSDIWGGSIEDHRSTRRERLLTIIADELATAGHQDVELAKRIAEKVAQLYEEGAGQ